MSSNAWFYTLLEEERNAYVTGNIMAPSRMSGQQKKWIKLLREDDASLGRLSNAQQSVRRRARDNLRDISQNLGPEVLLLCFQVQVSQLAKVEPKGLLKDLREWWDSATHPASLTSAADTFRKELGQPDVSSAVADASSTAPQEVFSEYTSAGGMKLCL
jgi:hypothetical protein